MPLLDRLRDVWPEAGSGDGSTIPPGAPESRIDLVLVDHSIRALRAWTVPTDASDHRPALCDLELAGPRHQSTGG